jgi:hypothetical protein
LLTLLGCRIIHAEYILEVAAVIPSAINLSFNISLLMGNLPFTSSENLEEALLGAIVTAMVRGRSSARAPSGRDEAQSQNHGDLANGEDCEDKS